MRPFEKFPAPFRCGEFFPAVITSSSVKTLSRFEVECLRSYYKEPGCRRRVREMVALVMVDESGKMARNKAFARNQLMLETEHQGDSRSTFLYSYAHYY